MGSEVLGWQFVLVPSSCLLHLACPKPTYIWGHLYPGLGWAPCSVLGLILRTLDSTGLFAPWGGQKL